MVKEENESDEEFRSRKNEKDAIVIETLIREYFALEKKKIEDSIPKSIMFSLVNFMKENAYSELLAKLYKDEENLLAESEDITKQREDAVLMLKALRVADETIDTVYDVAV
jgi:dynamin 1-like protein